MIDSNHFAFPSQLHFNHIRRLTNHIGIIQHAKYAIPDYHHGYCLDDNARALQLVSHYRLATHDDTQNDLIDIYLAYIYYVQNNDGTFRNFVNIGNRNLDEVGSEDAFARTIMALGNSLYADDRIYIQRMIKEILDRSYEQLKSFQSIRAAAYTIVGLYAVYQSQVYPKDVTVEINNLAQFIASEYHQASSKDWHWFERNMTYDNATLPYALFLAHQITPNDDWYQIAIDSSLFLDHIIFHNAVPTLIGNAGWHAVNMPINSQGQQPVEIASLILLYQKFNELVKDQFLKGTAKQCYSWYFGNNSMNQSLYDPETQGCFDGIDNDTINYNQGAESVISLWQSYLYINHSF